MYLSKLELFGFKSFANKTKLKFNNGITCVIGPNGSGKSNIVDSIRWVLGEQRVSTLRGDKMESVIFNGSAKRKSLGVAEVSMTIQNNKNIIDSPFSEVVISRRLFRNGESQYLINNTVCRLRDVVDLFMDTGMNANAYSVIELKMVESIISDNPEERRVLFEEAAGVTKYKVRRKSAIRKLISTKADMSRISDMISEISRTVNSLSRQVGKARRYLTYQEELQGREIDLARYKYNQLLDEIRPMEHQLKEINVIKEDTSHQITLEEALLEDYKREIVQYEQSLSSIGREVYAFDKEIQSMHEEDAVSRTRSASLMETEKNYLNDIETFSLKHKNLQSDLEISTIDYNNSKEEVQKTEKKYEKSYAAYTNELELHKSQKDEIDNLNNLFKQKFEEVSKLNELVQSKSYQVNWNEEQEQILIEEIENLKKEKEEIKQKESNYSIIMAELEVQKAEMTLKLEGINEKLKLSNTDLESLKNNLQSNIQKKETIRSKINFYEHTIISYEGHSKGTKYLMQNKTQFEGLHGPISDFLSIENKYRKALEIALGPAVDYVIVENTDNAKSIIKKCSSDDIGRITLLPLDRIKNISYNKHTAEFSYPLLSDLIKETGDYKIIFDLLVGDYAFVETLDDAINASAKYHGFKFVTQSGEIAGYKSGISGGQKLNDEASLIGRKKQLAGLKDEYEKINSQIQLSQAEYDLKLQHINELTNTITQITAEEKTIAHEIIEKKQTLSQLVYTKEKTKETINKKEDDVSSISVKISGLNKELKEFKSDISESSEILQSFEADLNSKKGIYESELESLNILDKEVQEIKLELIRHQNNFQNKSHEIERIKQSIRELDELIEKRKNEIEDIKAELNKLESEKENRNIRKNEVYEQRDQKSEEKTKIEVLYQEIKDKIMHLENQIKKYRKQHDTTLERTKHLELQIQENKIKSETIKENIRNAYSTDITIGIPFDGINTEEYEQEIESLKYKIKQLGQVNPIAVSEYDKESKRLDFYQKQFDDLKQAEESLQQTIDKINKTAREQYLETFGNIKTNFEKVFNNFFQNGEGTLNLQEGDDPLEADIEIKVRPKGKQVQTLNLLSGGEKTLTAISILFAIYLVKPSPFCILDEIDAPLDDVNITRFTDALKDFSKDTQFIVITHNKRTMEAAGTLYGVTMEEEGLSKLVSVSFN